MEKTILIKELCSKPSVAIRAAITAITELSEHPRFEVYMDSFGRVDVYPNQPVCLGCLATATIMKVTGITPEKFIEVYEAGWDGISNHAQKLNLDYLEISNFEYAIDDLRGYNPAKLLNFYGITEFSWGSERIKGSIRAAGLESFDTLNWRRGMPILEDIAEKLEEMGY